MARDAVAITNLAVNDATALAAGVAINPANNAVIAAGGNTQRLAIHVTITNAGGADVTVKAGSNPPAFAAGQGDLVETFAQNDEKFFVIESARFAQANGDIYVDFEAGATGTIAAYRLPKV